MSSAEASARSPADHSDSAQPTSPALPEASLAHTSHVHMTVDINRAAVDVEPHIPVNVEVTGFASSSSAASLPQQAHEHELELQQVKFHLEGHQKAELDDLQLAVKHTSTTCSSEGEVNMTVSDDPPVNSSLQSCYMSVDELSVRFATRLNHASPSLSQGLTHEEAEQRLLRDGPNQLTPPPQTPEIVKYLMKFLDPFMLLLSAAGVLCFVAYALDPSIVNNMWVGVVLLVAVAISATFTYIQEGRASQTMKSFQNMLPKNAKVIRNGTQSEIPASQLVVGDVVRVCVGDQVPADVRLIHAVDLKTERAALTGESVPIAANAATMIAQQHDKLEDATNIIFNSCQCMEGECVGVVVAVGDNSLIGTIASIVANTESVPTPIQVEIRHFVVRLSAFAFALGVVFLSLGFIRGKSWVSAFINSFVVVMVACIPEGLPLTVISCLTVAAKRMANNNVFIKQLNSVETLGSVTCIASDKTGTLTQSKMSVVNLWLDQIPTTALSVQQHFPIALPSLKHSLAPKLNSSVLGMTSASMASDSGDVSTLGFSRGHLITFNLLELAAGCCNRAKYADQITLTSQQAHEIERAQLLSNLDASLTMNRMKVQFPTLLGSLEPGVSLQSALARYSCVEEFARRDQSKRTIIGDATDTALLQFVASRQNIELLRYHNPIVFELPFNSRNKYALTIVKPHEVRESFPLNSATSNSKQSQHIGEPLPQQYQYKCRRLFMKGAPEVILSKCSSYMKDGVSLPIDDEFLRNYQSAYQVFGGRGERVLGFAWLELNEQQYGEEMDEKYSAELENYPTSDLCFIGLISLVDPPKPHVDEAIVQCRAAGIKVIMVTGDHPITAAAIARQIHILNSPTAEMIASVNQIAVEEVPDHQVDAVIVTGSQISTFNQADWDRVLMKQEIVFARTTPTQKLQIVENLQRLNHIVAVTGDGVNDSPALKKADVGVAMGINGSDVARDSADVVLMDDNFSSIVAGVKEGRTIFDNLAKTIAYTIAHLVPETIPTLLSLCIDFPAPLAALAILAIDLGSELAPAISFAYEPSESDVMARPPRRRNDRLVSLRTSFYVMFTYGFAVTAFCFMGFLLVMKHYDIDLSRLPYSSDYWAMGSDYWYVSGPSQCSNDMGNANYAPDCKYYTDAQQVNILNEAAGCYFWLLTSTQVMHIITCKTRVVSLFQHDLFANPMMIYGVLIEVILMCLFLFVPSLNNLLVGAPFPPLFFLLPLIPWTYLLISSEVRKALARKYQQSKLAHFINW